MCPPALRTAPQPMRLTARTSSRLMFKPVTGSCSGTLTRCVPRTAVITVRTSLDSVVGSSSVDTDPTLVTVVAGTAPVGSAGGLSIVTRKLTVRDEPCATVPSAQCTVFASASYDAVHGVPTQLAEPAT